MNKKNILLDGEVGGETVQDLAKAGNQFVTNTPTSTPKSINRKNVDGEIPSEFGDDSDSSISTNSHKERLKGTSKSNNSTNVKKEPIITDEKVKKILGDAYRHNKNNKSQTILLPKKDKEYIDRMNFGIGQRLDEIGLLFSSFFGISFNNAIIELDVYTEEENELDEI